MFDGRAGLVRTYTLTKTGGRSKYMSAQVSMSVLKHFGFARMHVDKLTVCISSTILVDLRSTDICTPIEHGKQACLSSLRLKFAGWFL